MDPKEQKESKDEGKMSEEGDGSNEAEAEAEAAAKEGRQNRRNQLLRQLSRAGTFQKALAQVEQQVAREKPKPRQPDQPLRKSLPPTRRKEAKPPARRQRRDRPWRERMGIPARPQSRQEAHRRPMVVEVDEFGRHVGRGGHARHRGRPRQHHRDRERPRR